VVAGAAAILALWFLPELWGSGQLFRAAERANNPDPQSPAYAADPFVTVIKTYGRTLVWPLFAIAGIAVGGAVARRTRERALLGLGGMAVAWLLLVALMTQAGYSGNPRYLMPVTAVVCVLVGVGVARLLEVVPAPRPAWLRAGIAVVLIAVVGGLVYDRPQLDAVTKGLRTEAELNDQLATAVRHAGGDRAVLACGQPFTGAYQVPALAWDLHVHTIRVGLAPHPPAAVFRTDGWPRMPPVPPSPPYRELATAGHWQVYGACR
jgi:hypothetical protein